MIILRSAKRCYHRTLGKMYSACLRLEFKDLTRNPFPDSCECVQYTMYTEHCIKFWHSSFRFASPRKNKTIWYLFADLRIHTVSAIKKRHQEKSDFSVIFHGGLKCCLCGLNHRITFPKRMSNREKVKNKATRKQRPLSKHLNLSKKNRYFCGRLSTRTTGKVSKRFLLCISMAWCCLSSKIIKKPPLT